MSPAPSMYEHGTPHYDDTTPYAVPVYDRNDRDRRTVIEVDATSTLHAQTQALVIAKRHHRMTSPAADEPRRVITDVPKICTAAGCEEVRGKETRGLCNAHFAERKDAFRCTTPGCENVTSGRPSQKCRPCANGLRTGAA